MGAMRFGGWRKKQLTAVARTRCARRWPRLAAVLRRARLQGSGGPVVLVDSVEWRGRRRHTGRSVCWLVQFAECVRSLPDELLRFLGSSGPLLSARRRRSRTPRLMRQFAVEGCW